MSYRIVLARRADQYAVVHPSSDSDGMGIDENAASSITATAPLVKILPEGEDAVSAASLGALGASSSHATLDLPHLITVTRLERLGRDKVIALESMASELLHTQHQETQNTLVHAALAHVLLHGEGNQEISQGASSQAGSTSGGSSRQPSMSGGDVSWHLGHGGILSSAASSVSRATLRSNRSSNKQIRKRRLEKLRGEENAKKDSWRIDAQVQLFAEEGDRREALEEERLLDFVEITKYYFVDVDGNFVDEYRKLALRSKDVPLVKRATAVETALMMANRASRSSSRVLSSRFSVAATHHSSAVSLAAEDPPELGNASNPPIEDDPVFLRKQEQHVPVRNGLVRELISVLAAVQRHPASGNLDAFGSMNYAARDEREMSFRSVASSDYEMDGVSEWEEVSVIGQSKPKQQPPTQAPHRLSPATQSPRQQAIVMFLPNQLEHIEAFLAGDAEPSSARAPTAAGAFANDIQPGRLGGPSLEHGAPVVDELEGDSQAILTEIAPTTAVTYNSDGNPVRLRNRKLGPVVGGDCKDKDPLQESMASADSNQSASQAAAPPHALTDAERDQLLLGRFQHSLPTRTAMLLLMFESARNELWADQVLEFTTLVSVTSPYHSIQSRKVSVIKSSQTFLSICQRWMVDLQLLQRVEWRQLARNFARARRSLLSRLKAELIVEAREEFLALFRIERKERAQLYVNGIPCHPLFAEFKPSTTPSSQVPLRFAWSQWNSSFESKRGASKLVSHILKMAGRCAFFLSDRYFSKMVLHTRNRGVQRSLDRIREDAEKPLMNQVFSALKAPAIAKVSSRRLRIHLHQKRAMCLHGLLSRYLSKWLRGFVERHPPPPEPLSTVQEHEEDVERGSVSLNGAENEPIDSDHDPSQLPTTAGESQPADDGTELDDEL